MINIIFTISIIGFLVGFICSMPIAGTISILITSNALKGKMRYCTLVAAGASIADFIYVFISVFGLTKLYSFYKPFIPYVLFGGAIFLFFIGYKTVKTKLGLENIDEKNYISKKIKKERGGFWTGLILNFLNPTLFMGWLTSSFFVISLITSLGFNTGGLEILMGQNIQQINKTGGNNINSQNTISYFQVDTVNTTLQQIHRENNARLPNYFPFLVSICYAFFLSLGGIMWFYFLARFLVKYRTKFNLKVMNRVIQILGIVLCLFGVFLVYTVIKMII